MPSPGNDVSHIGVTVCIVFVNSDYTVDLLVLPGLGLLSLETHIHSTSFALHLQAPPSAHIKVTNCGSLELQFPIHIKIVTGWQKDIFGCQRPYDYQVHTKCCHYYDDLSLKSPSIA